MTDTIVILITAGSGEEAANIAKTLVAERMIACANIVPGVRSFFTWEGETKDAAESLLICKSRRSLLDGIIGRVKELHSYSVPEVIALPVMGGSQDYLDWVRDATEKQP